MPEISHPIPALNTSSQAATAAANALSNLGSNRFMPPMLPMLQRVAAENIVTVFNVGPWPHQVLLGSLGTFLIPAYTDEVRKRDREDLEMAQLVFDEAKGTAKEDAKRKLAEIKLSTGFASMRALPGIVSEYTPLDETRMTRIDDEGEYVAQQIIHEGKHLNPRNSLRQFGVGYCKGAYPGSQLLADAEAALNAYAQQLFLDAQDASDKGPDALRLMRSDRHIWAARRINRPDAPWVAKIEVTGNVKCKSCGVMSSPDTAICPNCRFILNRSAYEAIKDGFAS